MSEGAIAEFPEAAGAPPLVEVAALTVAADHGPILDRIDLAIAAGSVHALVGRNGAGKSTLLAALLGEVEFTGTIRLRFRDAARRIGYVPQRLAIEKVLALTAGEFLALSRQRRPVCFGLAPATRTRVRALLAEVGLAGFEDRLLARLSGGELKRVLLAHALDPRPELLLLDEPTEGLDATARTRFLELVLAAKSAGTTVLLASHDLAPVRRLADRATWLDARVRAQGETAVVLAAYAAADAALATGAHR